VLCFTAEEVWQARYPSEDGSVHLLDWPEVPASNLDAAFAQRWVDIRGMRAAVNETIEPARRDKVIRSSLEADVHIQTLDTELTQNLSGIQLAEILISSDVTVGPEGRPDWIEAVYTQDTRNRTAITTAHRTSHHKCGRCWRHLPEVDEDGSLCARCEGVVAHA
jgi:isoleucyl-tRNA synthetase